MTSMTWASYDVGLLALMMLVGPAMIADRSDIDEPDYSWICRPHR